MSLYKVISILKKAAYKLFIERGIKKSFGSCGEKVHISRDGEFYPERNIVIGNNISVGPYALFWTLKAKIIIEDNVLFGPHVTIITGDHRTDVIGRNIIDISDEEKLPENDADVVIGNGAWIGANVTILKGVHVGAGAVIAAGSVVLRDIEPYTVYAGVPARKIKNRFSEEQLVEHLKKLS